MLISALKLCNIELQFSHGGTLIDNDFRKLLKFVNNLCSISLINCLDFVVANDALNNVVVLFCAILFWR